MNRKWIFAVVSVLAVALVMFPLNLLWVGQSPLHAAVSSLLFGLSAAGRVAPAAARGFFRRPLRRRASAMIHWSWPLIERNSSAAHSSSASIVAVSIRSTKLLLLFSLAIPG